MLAGLRREFHDARHHCSAWLVGPDRTVQRSSDDGEPSGTAGMPMLEAMSLRRTRVDDSGREVSDLSDLCAVVVRWFGGTLLGAGGLVRAYSDAVSQALGQATMLQRARVRVFAVAAPLADGARWENELRSAGTAVLGTDWSATGATLRIATADTPEDIEKLRAHLAELTAGAARPEPIATEWVDLPAPLR